MNEKIATVKSQIEHFCGDLLLFSEDCSPEIELLVANVMTDFGRDIGKTSNLQQLEIALNKENP